MHWYPLVYTRHRQMAAASRQLYAITSHWPESERSFLYCFLSSRLYLVTFTRKQRIARRSRRISPPRSLTLTLTQP